MKRLTGVVTRIVTDAETRRRRGFGFITAGGAEYFFHAAALPSPAAFDQLAEGDRVTFAPQKAAKGLRAVAVRFQ